MAATNNPFQQLRMHDGMANGWYLTDGASNLVLNCDAYNNRGLDSGSLGNTDGFGCHPAHTTGTGNILRGCRSWFNSDDGYDCINAYAMVTFDHCWSFYNGYFTNFASSTGDGNGIKGGGYGDQRGSHSRRTIPHHIIEFCLTVSNRASGFYANHHLDGQVWLNNTAYRQCHRLQHALQHEQCEFRRRRARLQSGDEEQSRLQGEAGAPSVDQTANDVTFNYFTLPVTGRQNDFMSLDESC